jgi:hypothetical protein
MANAVLPWLARQLALPGVLVLADALLAMLAPSSIEMAKSVAASSVQLDTLRPPRMASFASLRCATL